MDFTSTLSIRVESQYLYEIVVDYQLTCRQGKIQIDFSEALSQPCFMSAQINPASNHLVSPLSSTFTFQCYIIKRHCRE